MDEDAPGVDRARFGDCIFGPPPGSTVVSQKVIGASSVVDCSIVADGTMERRRLPGGLSPDPDDASLEGAFRGGIGLSTRDLRL